MKIEFSKTEYLAGTKRRRIYMYEDDGDVIMTDEPVYEVEDEDEEDDSEYQYDGPVEEEDSL